MGEMASGSNWLGFSLSPHTTMEVPSASEPAPPAHHAPPPTSTTISSSGNHAAATSDFLFSPMPAPYPGYYCVGGAYGDGTSSAGAYYSHLPTVPIKSDGSICNIEGMMPSSPPKLEDFLGGGNGNGGGQETATYYSHQQCQEEASRDYHQYQHHQLVPYNFQPLTEVEMLQEDAAMAAAKNFLLTSYGACYSNGEMHPLSLSMMSPGSQSSSCVSAAPQQQQQIEIRCRTSP